jgi:hypothetical protein
VSEASKEGKTDYYQTDGGSGNRNEFSASAKKKVYIHQK